jgi:hypothetical protein
LFAAVIKLIDNIFGTDLVNDWGKTAVGWVEDINEWVGNLIDSANRFITALSKPENIVIIKAYLTEMYHIIVDELIPAVVAFAKAVTDWVISAFKLVIDWGGKIYEFMKGVFGFISGAVQVIVGSMKILFGAFLGSIDTMAEGFYGIVEGLGQQVVDNIKLSLIWLEEEYWKFQKLIALSDARKDRVEGELRGLAAERSLIQNKIDKGASKPEDKSILDLLNKILDVNFKGLTELSGIMKNIEPTIDVGNKILKETNDLLKERKEIAENPLSKMGFALRDLGKEYHDAETNTFKKIDLNKEIENQLDYLRTMARWNKQEFNEEKARKKLEAQVSEEYSRMFGKAFKHIKDSKFAEESGLTGDELNKAAMGWTKSLMHLTEDQLKENKIFKSLNQEQQSAILESSGMFIRLRDHGNSSIDYFKESAKMSNKFVQDVLTNDTKLMEQAKKIAEEEAKRAKEKTDTEKKLGEIKEKETKKSPELIETNKIESSKPTSVSELKRGSTAGLQSVHESTKTVSDRPPIIKIDRESLKDLGEMVAVNKEQLGVLDSIDKKIGKNLYNRNNPSYNEVTATVWGA